MFTNCFEDKILVVLESIFITCLTIILNPYNNIIAVLFVEKLIPMLIHKLIWNC